MKNENKGEKMSKVFEKIRVIPGNQRTGWTSGILNNLGCFVLSAAAGVSICTSAPALAKSMLVDESIILAQSDAKERQDAARSKYISPVSGLYTLGITPVAFVNKANAYNASIKEKSRFDAPVFTDFNGTPGFVINYTAPGLAMLGELDPGAGKSAAIKSITFAVSRNLSKNEYVVATGATASGIGILTETDPDEVWPFVEALMANSTEKPEEFKVGDKLVLAAYSDEHDVVMISVLPIVE